MKKKIKFKDSCRIFCVLVLGTTIAISSFSQNQVPSVNLLVNPFFEFHSFINHRQGIAVSHTSHNIAFWNTDAWNDITVSRESHVPDSVRPKFSTKNLVALSPGKKIWQFFTLPEAGLAYGDFLNLLVYGYQPKSNLLKAKIKLLKLDSEDGEWVPKNLGMQDARSFPRQARGELVIAKEYSVSDPKTGSIELRINKAEIIGKAHTSKTSSSEDINTIGIQVEFENLGGTDTAWIYNPWLTSENCSTCIPGYTRMIPNYRYIPRTIQKLWKGEVIHIIVMGSSIDRGSANPPQYLYDENPASKTFKQPIAEGLFDGQKIGRPDLDGYFGEWRHYFSWSGRLKLELMRKFNLGPDKICLNFQACDGSSIGEAHSGLKEYCSLSLPPEPGLNGHKKGKTWQQLYPGLFSRPEGTAPDLVIFGSGANEKTDTPDEVAVFEGAIRWIQQHYPHTEFLFSQFQNSGEYTPNPGDLQALSLRYQIPFLDYGRIGDDVTRWCNPYALVPSDGHPQGAGHFLRFKEIEKIFECWDPIVPGQAQLHLPERVHQNSYGWEGEMRQFDRSSARIKGNRFIFEDMAVNCWGKVDEGKPVPYVDGAEYESRASFPDRDIRNSMFRFGRCSLGDRHILEITGDNPVLTFVDSKICPNRSFYPVDNPNWKISGLPVKNYDSHWGAPYGSKMIHLEPGKSIEIEVVGTDLSVAFVDAPNGGTLNVFVDSQLKLSQATNTGFMDTDHKLNFLENRKGILNIGYGWHKIRLEAKNAPVSVLGLFAYDSRSDHSAERRLQGFAKHGETVEFSLPFRARPLVICSGGLSVKLDDVTLTGVKFSGTSGTYQVIGE